MYTYIFDYACIYIYTYTYIFDYVCIHTCIHTYLIMYVYIYIYIYTYIFDYVCIHVYIVSAHAGLWQCGRRFIHISVCVCVRENRECDSLMSELDEAWFRCVCVCVCTFVCSCWAVVMWTKVDVYIYIDGWIDI